MHKRQHSYDEVQNKNMAHFFPGKEAWWAAYDSGEYCHVGLHYEADQDYGQTSIPKAYVLREWVNQFELVDFIDDRAVCSQDVIVARRI